MRHLHLLILIILFKSLQTCLAQPRKEIEFERISMEAGLSQSTVYYICQDHKGFLWFATYDGLNKYDGYGFTVYRPEINNPNSISSNAVFTIFEDKFNNLWIGTQNGINLFNRDKESFVRITHDPENKNSLSHNEVRAICMDTDSAYWIGTLGGGLNCMTVDFDTLNLSKSKFRFEHYRHEDTDSTSISSDYIRELKLDNNSILWLGTENGISKFNRKTGKSKNYKIHESKNKNFIFSIIKDSRDRMWFGTSYGLFRFNNITEKFTRIDLPLGDGDYTVWYIYEDTINKLWFGTTRYGLINYDPKDNSCYQYINKRENPVSLSDVMVRSIYEDHSGVLWIGTSSGGLNKYDRGRQKFITYHNGSRKGKSVDHDFILALHEDKNGILWIGSFGGGITRYNRETGEMKQYAANQQNTDSLYSDYIFSITEDKNNRLWIGTRSSLEMFDKKEERFYHFRFEADNQHYLSDSWVKKVFIDSRGILWVGTSYGGLNKLRLDTIKAETNAELVKNARFEVYKHDENSANTIGGNNIKTIYEDKDGYLWIGTWGNGLCRMDVEKELFTTFTSSSDDSTSISNNFVYSIYESENGVLWLGTNGGGLNKIDRKNNVFEAVTEQNGLSNNVIYGILEDNDANLWLSTNKGLNKFSPSDMKIQSYDIDDGLQSNEFNGGAYFRNNNGEMFFGGIDGFNIFYPSTIKDNTKLPKIVLTEFKIFNQPIIPIPKELNEKTRLVKSISEADEINLYYGDYVISFEFVAIHYSAPEKNQYAYMMEGFDKNWIFSENRRFATYTNLPIGKYTFNVKGSNCDNVWNNTPASIRVIVHPPFWQTWWFKLLAVLIIVSLSYAVYFHKRRQILKLRSRELEWKVKERTAEALENVTRGFIKQYETSQAIKTSDKTALVSKSDAKSESIRPFVQNDNDEIRETEKALPKISLPGYEIRGFLSQSRYSLIFSGIRKEDNLPVVLKACSDTTQSEIHNHNLFNEYEILKNINHEGINKPLTFKKHKRGFIIYKDIKGQALDKILSARKLKLNEFLYLAIRIAEIVGFLHSKSIIHKGICPANIIWNPTKDIVHIIDFKYASLFVQGAQMSFNPATMDNLLPYISPEQTGRTNQQIDFRTDFYSMGITFYEMLLGFTPFHAEEPLELAHAHIATEPISPSRLSKKIPKAISDIIVKMLSKSAEGRYQSDEGLISDLKRCFKELSKSGKINDFAPGRNDKDNRFRIPQKIYGREKETGMLLNSFNAVFDNDKSRMILIAGYAGVGKSVLVNEIHRPVIEHNAFVTTGVYNQFQRNIPYGGIIQAFRRLTQQILTESPKSLRKWKNGFIKALGENGSAIVEVIPEMQNILNLTGDTVNLQNAGGQNLFIKVFKSFVSVFAQKEHPLVLFLDNLHWADLSSLKLLEQIIPDNDIKYLFVIAAYRNNEVNDTHPMKLTIDNIKRNKDEIEELNLKPLELVYINQLISDTLKAKPENTYELSESCLSKTNGNPFFLKQFLTSLYKEKLIWYEVSQNANEEQYGQWHWSIDEIKKSSITENVIDLMVTNIKQLPENTQQALKFAACIGNPFNINTLALFQNKTIETVILELKDAVNEGLLIPINRTFNFTNKSASNIDDHLAGGTFYKFLHDRIHQAVYSLIDNHRKNEIHLEIGRLLLHKSIKNQINTNLFEIVNQLNESTSLITTENERNQLAQLNLQAGRKAKLSAAYEATFNYLETGINLMKPDDWKNNYNLCLELYEEGAEAAYLCGFNAKMNTWIGTILNETKTGIDKTRAYEVKIQSYHAQNKHTEAIETAITCLKQYGFSLSSNPSKLQVKKAFIETKIAIAGRKIEELINLPEMKDISKKAPMRIMSSMIWAVYSSSPNLFSIIVFKMINLSVKYGNTPESTFAYAGYGQYLCGVKEDIEKGYNFGKLALQLLDKFDTKSIKIKTLMLVNTFIMHWKEHPGKHLQELLDGYKEAIDAGDFEYAAHFIIAYCARSFYIGIPLDVLSKDMERYNIILQKLKQEKYFLWQSANWQLIRLLTIDKKQPELLSGKVFDETKTLATLLEANDRTGIFLIYFFKLIVNYIFCNNKAAIESAKVAWNYIDGATSMFIIPIFHFFDSLALLSIYKTAQKPQRKEIIKHVGKNQEKMRKWAKSAPMNYQHKYYIVEAELSRVTGNDLESMENFDKAIKLANENGYLHEEALANELAARFYLERGKRKIARNFMKDTIFRYRQWGATAKIVQIEKQYPEITEKKKENKPQKSAKTDEIIFDSLDFSSFMKVSQILSAEIILEKLMRKMLELVNENAGSQKGFLILTSKERLFIEAGKDANNKEIEIFKSIPLDSGEAKKFNRKLSFSIINFVARSKSAIVLNNATEEGAFVNDPYVIDLKPKSVLCIPLLNKGDLSGIIYLENNLAQSVFTEKRVQVLRMLSTYMAIAIDNARKYDNLEEEIQYLRSGLKETDSKKYMEQILNYMQSEKPFLANKLSLSQVSKALDISTHHVSQVINENLNQSFTDFVNNYRIKEVKKRLQDPDYKSFTILSIAYDCGFSSKSNFNSVFKKLTNLTPRQYMKTLESKDKE